MTKYIVYVPDPMHDQPARFEVEAHRFLVFNGMVQFYKEYNSSNPCAAFPVTSSVVEAIIQ